MTRFITGLITTIGLAALATPAAAQLEARFDDPSIQTRATLTIPFGGDHRTVAAKPKLALGLRSETPRRAQNAWMFNDQIIETREVNFALTLESRPTFLMNDQVLQFGDTRSADEAKTGGLDKYDKTVLTVIGGSLVIIIGAVAYAAVVD